MFPGILLFQLLLASSLLALLSLDPPKLPAAGPASGEIQGSSSFESPQRSNDDKYSLRGVVVNSVTGEAIRGALVQIFINGQRSILTGPDGKFQFDGLPAGQTSITVRKPGFFAEDDFRPAK